MKKNNVYSFPPSEKVELSEQDKKTFNNIQREIDEEVDLFESYLNNGPSDNPFVKKRQEEIENDYYNSVERILFGTKKKEP